MWGNEIRRGNRLPLGDQESVGQDAQRGVVMEAAPTPPFEMPEPNFLLEFLVIASVSRKAGTIMDLSVGKARR